MITLVQNIRMSFVHECGFIWKCYGPHFPFLLRNSLQRQKLWMSSLCMLFKVWSLTNNWVNKTSTTTQHKACSTCLTGRNKKNILKVKAGMKLLTLSAWHFCSGWIWWLGRCEPCEDVQWREGQCQVSSDSPMREDNMRNGRCFKKRTLQKRSSIYFHALCV